MPHPPECDGEIYYCRCGFGPTTIERVRRDRHVCFDPPRRVVRVNLPVVMMTRDIYDRFAGLTMSGCLVVDDDGIKTALTRCCNAFATFHDEQLCCKACWREVPLEHCTPAEIAVARHLVNACIPPENPQPE